MSRPLPPCGKSCPRRRLGCHDPDICPDWGEYQERCRQYNETIKEARRAEDDFAAAHRHTAPELVDRRYRHY